MGYVAMIAVSAHADEEAVTKMLDEAGAVYEPHSALTFDDQIVYVVAGSKRHAHARRYSGGRSRFRYLTEAAACARARRSRPGNAGTAPRASNE